MIPFFPLVTCWDGGVIEKSNPCSLTTNKIVCTRCWAFGTSLEHMIKCFLKRNSIEVQSIAKQRWPLDSAYVAKIFAVFSFVCFFSCTLYNTVNVIMRAPVVDWYECRYTTKTKLVTFELCGISYFHSFVSRHDDSCLNSWWYQYIIQSQSALHYSQTEKSKKSYTQWSVRNQLWLQSRQPMYRTASEGDSAFLWRKHLSYWMRPRY